MSEGTFSSIEIDAPAEAVYRVAADIASYPEWATGVKEVEVIEHDDQGRVRRARFVVEAGVREIEYVLRYEHDPPNRMTWVAEESDDVRMLEGSYTFKPVDGVTEVAYGLSIELNFNLPGFLRRQAEKQIVSTALRGLRRRVGGGG